MIDTRVWLSTGKRGGQGGDIARDEPSHIHLPRRRRIVRPAGQGTSPTWAAEVGNDELPRAQPVVTDA